MEAIKLFLLVAHFVLAYDNGTGQVLEQFSAELVQCFARFAIYLEVVVIDSCSFSEDFAVVVDFI